MGRGDFFINLPSELTAKILSRLPLRSLALSKCVCKPWRNLLGSLDFTKSLLFDPETPPFLACLTPARADDRIGSTRCTILEIEEEFGNPDNHLFIWNPLTCQYIEICRPKQSMSINFNYRLSLGFGVSQISGQYKVVCINRDGSAHHVYTLGTGEWRRLEAGAASGFGFRSYGRIVCNGNLHWNVYDSTRPLLICGFDVETECFSIFSAPPAAVQHPYVELSVLRDCLCVSYAWNDNIFFWSMKEYQVEESWTFEYRLTYNGYDFNFGDCYGIESVYPIKVFNDGDILMLMVPKHIDLYYQKTRLIYYSSKKGTIEQLGLIHEHLGPIDESLSTIEYSNRLMEQLRTFEELYVRNHLTHAMIFTPVLLSLKTFGIENVISY
ncbi:putative F-box protein At5g50220 [Salvia hispanica]|uniref:putative F-box protein At5g50220 n=1 Tax=Salvia hispanica TaxID=49212 RepID=UPI0020091E42|nr:putative F-box protein At5g50220 [Salvia hispanica]